ncbi:MAG: hypothetical protein EXR72_23840 [Myxococcales bacterium]|nr:hypothetical protein [Myxococcales bacterium]
MQIRISRVTRGAKTYEYPQLVESVRGGNGKPTHRVVANLSAFSPIEIHNLRVAITAARDGKRLVLQPQPAPEPDPPSHTPAPKILDNLRYLDLAVLHEIWNHWGLSDLLAELLPARATEVAASAVVAALVLQRCVAPGSKLFATEWFPRTALPELLAIDPAAFNNTRLHRVLDDLDDATAALMRRLPRRYHDTDGPCCSLFLDVTDTWFIGHGPALAARGKTKEGIVQRKIGIVLLCNERGYPLRWEVISGSCADAPAMTAMFKSIAGLSWVGTAPVVCDRAMGRTAQIRDMAATGLRFVTALTVTEFGAYSQRIPHQVFAPHLCALPPAGDPAARDRAIAAATGIAAAAGLEKVEDDLFVIDLGIIERAVDGPSHPSATAGAPAEAMRRCREIHEAVVDGRFPSYAAAGLALGMSQSLTQKYGSLHRLPEDVQREIVDGKADARTLAELIAIAKLRGKEEQRTAFQGLLKMPPATARPRSAATVSTIDKPAEPAHLKVRAALYFNPQRFVDQRLRAALHLAQIQTFLDELNDSLAAPRSRHDRDSLAAAIDRRLRSLDLLEVYRVNLHERTVADRTRYSVDLTRDNVEWARRRRYDGFSVVVAHPDLTLSAVELCRLYRAKDIVEKDFRAIKGLVELRPIHHHTDAKVRAHVTLCMLALLLERTLAWRLKGQHSAPAALEIFEPCRLNRLAAGRNAILHVLTATTPKQNTLLAALDMTHLADGCEVNDRLRRPR